MRTFKWLALLGFLLVPLAVYADEPIEGRVGRAEVRFMEGIIDHHQMAIDMSQVCLEKATTESVRQLCQEIIDKQSVEIVTLQGWLADWYQIQYQPVSMMAMMSGCPATGDMAAQQACMMEGMMMQPGSMMQGMATEEASMMADMAMDPAGMMGMMAFFNRTEGPAFEVAYLEAMADHHDDAIHMAQRIQSQAQHQPLLDMAQQIIDDQTAEIERIEQLLTELVEPAATSG